MGLILFIIAFVLTALIGSASLLISIVYYLVTLKWKSGLRVLNAFFYKLALSIDQFGNVVCAIPFQYLFTKPVAHNFGNEDDTVSYVIAKNKELGTLTLSGRLLGRLLDLLDKDHLKKAIKNKELKDIEACKRIKE